MNAIIGEEYGPMTAQSMSKISEREMSFDLFEVRWVSLRRLEMILAGLLVVCLETPPAYEEFGNLWKCPGLPSWMEYDFCASEISAGPSSLRYVLDAH